MDGHDEQTAMQQARPILPVRQTTRQPLIHHLDTKFLATTDSIDTLNGLAYCHVSSMIIADRNASISHQS